MRSAAPVSHRDWWHCCTAVRPSDTRAPATALPPNTSLGRDERAQQLTGAALDMLEPRFERNRVYYTAQRAQALLDSGDIEQAVTEARQACAIAGRVQSERVQGKLGDLRRELRRFAHVPAAADFFEQTRQTPGA
ncbi:hypothetical protein [Streptomyces sp. NBC_00038]|uniref:hypothetical protein n=1 Tax=Streptomyces sp. NBC_00038 TaxID=2903615 RepID=UPI00224C7C4D|nr:hypothetical protein [Streptomyces sp. NBC_00038]MCX5557540.1 hypothetical protein [Streptomyces sp. NBC_00038]